MEQRTQTKERPRLLAVFAHPDDETFCAGGTIAQKVAAGWEVMAVSATRGQAGQIRDPQAATRLTLGQVREREFYAACELLGVHHALVLDYMDGTLQEVDPHALTGAVVQVMRAFRPDVVITFGPDGAYGHPDHVAIGAATTHAFEQAGDPLRFPEQIVAGQRPYQPAQLYHSYFPHNSLLLGDRLAHWLVAASRRFRGTAEFVRALPLFAQEATTLRYASDHVGVEWFPLGSHIVEQGEPGASLYLILSGHADVVREDASGARSALARLGPGEFFGEQAIVHDQPRTAHVVAAEDVTCLVFAPSAPSAFAGRGTEARSFDAGRAGEVAAEPAPHTLVRVDASGQVDQKIAAVAAHRTQYPITPDLLPRPLLQELFGHEYFVHVHPSQARQASIQLGTGSSRRAMRALPRSAQRRPAALA
jgi:LmbE family N-acetylglucosaminyl deacetylase